MGRPRIGLFMNLLNSLIAHLLDEVVIIMVDAELCKYAIWIVSFYYRLMTVLLSDFAGFYHVWNGRDWAEKHIQEHYYV